MAWERELELAVVAAQTAGVLLHDAFSAPCAILKKTAHDVKLQADLDSEKAIFDVLETSAYGILSEEAGVVGDIESGKPFWVVDPLDGTSNFSRGIPLCCVSIALFQRGKALLGVIYDFNRGELFTAVTGGKATCNKEAIRVSKVTKAAEAVLTTGTPVNYVYDDAGFRRYMQTLQRFRKVRQIGTSALSLAWTAAGRADAYCEDDIMFWDIAAGVALLQAAGGYVTMQPSDTAKWARRIRAAAAESIWMPARKT
jgi:myo-inositol-1(or 4)-monophosphatase